jgi:hypothetical protein
MNLQNKKGHKFCLEVVGYAFPSNTDDYWDSNFLNVRIRGENALSSWNVEDTCLLTFEVEQLAKWLEKLVSDKTSSPNISFTEPSPQFRVLKHGTGSFLLRVELGYIFRKILPDIFGEKQYVFLYFPLHEVDLSYQAELLRKQLEKYPQRAFR